MQAYLPESLAVNIVIVNVVKLSPVAMVTLLEPFIRILPSCVHTTVGEGIASNPHWIVCRVFAAAKLLAGGDDDIVGGSVVVYIIPYNTKHSWDKMFVVFAAASQTVNTFR